MLGLFLFPIALNGHLGYGIITCEDVRRVPTGGCKSYVFVCFFCEINDGAGKDMFRYVMLMYVDLSV